MSIIVRDNGNVPFGIKEIMCKEEDELQEVDIEYLADGSTCLIVSTGNVYVLMDREWNLIGGE